MPKFVSPTTIVGARSGSSGNASTRYCLSQDEVRRYNVMPKETPL